MAVGKRLAANGRCGVSSRDQWCVIRASRLFDGRRGTSISNGAVVTNGEQIVAVGPQDELGLPAIVPPDATYLNHPGTVMPGLIDIHTHLTMPGDGTGYGPIMALSDEVQALLAAANARVALEAGITTLADTGARNRVTFALRRAIELGFATGPRLVLCGRPVTRTGGHCWFLNGEADGPDQIRSLVRELLKDGADIIKVMATGGGTPGSNPYRQSLHLDELQALVDEAHCAGVHAIAHSSATAGIRAAVTAGIDVIFHAHFYEPDGQLRFDPDVASLIARHATFVNPTLWVNRVLVEQMEQREATLSPEERSVLDQRRRRYDGQEKNVAKLVEAGVRLVAGSDAGWGAVSFDGLVREMELMAGIGMRPPAVLRSATHEGAQALGIDDRVGTLEPGKRADLLLVDGDPTEDIGALRRVVGVMHDGAWVRLAASISSTCGSESEPAQRAEAS